MATRALFGYLRKDGSLRMVYNHFDGQPNVLGKALRKLDYEALVSKVDDVFERAEVPRWNFSYPNVLDADLELAQRDAEWFYVMDFNGQLWAAPSDWDWNEQKSYFAWDKFRPVWWWEDNQGDGYSGQTILSLMEGISGKEA